MLEEYLYKLVEKMTVKEKVSSSDESVSFKAHREAEKIDDKNALEILKTMIISHSLKKDKEFRNACYFIYGKLLIKFPVYDYLSFYIEQIKKEDDKYMLTAMLDSLYQIEIPEGISPNAVITLADNEKWQIRYSAILALGSFHNEKCREKLREFISKDDEKKFKEEIIYANAAMGKCGEKNDIPYLKRHENSRVRDIRISATVAIEKIIERNL